MTLARALWTWRSRSRFLSANTARCCAPSSCVTSDVEQGVEDNTEGVNVQFDKFLDVIPVICRAHFQPELENGTRLHFLTEPKARCGEEKTPPGCFNIVGLYVGCFWQYEARRRISRAVRENKANKSGYVKGVEKKRHRPLSPRTVLTY